MHSSTSYSNTLFVFSVFFVFGIQFFKDLSTSRIQFDLWWIAITNRKWENDVSVVECTVNILSVTYVAFPVNHTLLVNNCTDFLFSSLCVAALPSNVVVWMSTPRWTKRWCRKSLLKFKVGRPHFKLSLFSFGQAKL